MSPSTRLKLAVFDVAGTTVAASDDVAGAFRAAFETHGLDVSAGAIAAVRGKSKKRAIEELVEATGEDEAGKSISDEIYRDFTRLLIESSRGWRPIRGARETLEWFGSRGVRVALTTGLDRSVLDVLLERLGWTEELLSATVCAQDVRRGRPAPDLIHRSMELCRVRDPQSVLAVGDTKVDLLAAENAGVGWSIGVSSGAHEATDLALGPHSAILESVAELPAWCEGRGLS